MRAKALLLIAISACLLLLSQGASAELTQQGKLLVGFNGGLSPKALPRDKPVPVAVEVEGRPLAPAAHDHRRDQQSRSPR
jgi:hypothetical protein